MAGNMIIGVPRTALAGTAPKITSSIPIQTAKIAIQPIRAKIQSMKFKTFLIAAIAVALSSAQAFAQATILPPGETCFSALAPTSGGPANTGTGYLGLLGTITAGSGYKNGTYGGVPLTGGSGTNATANITVSGGIVTGVAVLNPGLNYVAGDTLSAATANIGGTGSGFSVPVSSVALNFALSGGSVGFYIPNTLLIKQTWQDAAQTTLNQNPVPLDANGCAVIYGAGVYRMIVKDSLGNTAWDKLTTATGANGQGIFWAGQAGGTGNAITVVDTAFALQDGYNLQFLAVAPNSGPATISISGGGLIPIVNDTSSGPAALSGAEIGIGNTPLITYDATNVEFHLVNPASGSSSGGGGTALTPPQGYLNLVGQATGDVIQTGDVVAAITIFYSPFVGNTLPIWNGSTFVSKTFSELTATLTAAGSSSSAIQDTCVFSNNGVPTLVISPAWTTPTAGAGNRGTGAGSAQITRLQGVWVNAVSITGYNGLSSFSIPANQCTVVGSLSIDGTAGQVSAYRTFGQSRKFGVWNFYNRQPIFLKAGDSTGSWAAQTGGTLAPENGNTANSLQIFSGLPEEIYDSRYQSRAQTGSIAANSAASFQIGIGLNSTSAGAGRQGTSTITSVTSNLITVGFDLTAEAYISPLLGINVLTALERNFGTGNMNVQGGEGNTVLTVQWRG